MTWLETIKCRVKARNKNIAEDEDMLIELITTAFRGIMTYTKSDEYDLNWDDILIDGVIRLYNYSGIEGSIQRTNNGVTDKYESSNVLANFLSTSGLPHYIRPVGTTYSATRFKFPE